MCTDERARPPDRRPRRPLPHRGRAWCGRDGHRVPRPGPEARPEGRVEGPAPRAGSRARLRRFLGEIRLTAKLDHPHILTLIASGEDAGFLWYGGGEPPGRLPLGPAHVSTT